MTTLDLDELERRAKAATPGPWTQWLNHATVFAGVPTANVPSHFSGGSGEICECSEDQCEWAGDECFEHSGGGVNDEDGEEAEKCHTYANAAYIAAANPAAILELIGRLRKAEAR